MKLSKYLTQNSNSGHSISTIFKSFFEHYEIIKEENLPEIKNRFAEVRNNLFEVKILKVLVRNNETIKLLFENESFSNSKLKSMTFKHILTQIDPKILEFYDFLLKEFPFSKDSHMLKSKFDEIIKNSLSKTKKKDSLSIKEETPKNVSDIYKKEDAKVNENEEFKQNLENEDFGQENSKKSNNKIISKTEIENDKKEEGFESFEDDLEKLKQTEKENEEYDFEAEELDGLIYLYIFVIKKQKKR